MGAIQVKEIDVAVLPMKLMSVGGSGTVLGVALTGVENGLVPSMVVCAARNW